MQLVDTHCHIHEILGLDEAGLVPKKWHKAGVSDPDVVISHAAGDGVTKLVCVGTTVEDSDLAVQFVQERPGCWASIGIHPHEAKVYANDQKALKRFALLAKKP
jgi:TatD DNase family protein